MEDTPPTPPRVQRAYLVSLAARAGKGDSEAKTLLEDTLADLFDTLKSAPRVAERIRVSAATLYRWTAPGGPAGTLGDLLRQAGVMTRYDGRDAINRPGRRRGFKVVP